jgi:hypothetical protein
VTLCSLFVLIARLPPIAAMDGMTTPATILHADLDAFYASVEQ